jgi:hypothetical protein
MQQSQMLQTVIFYVRPEINEQISPPKSNVYLLARN